MGKLGRLPGSCFGAPDATRSAGNALGLKHTPPGIFTLLLESAESHETHPRRARPGSAGRRTRPKHLTPTLGKWHSAAQTLARLNLKSPPPTRKKKHERNGAGKAAGGTSVFPWGTFKKWNYPCSLVVLSKHPFFFTAPHKGPFDIFLMESAKPTFGSGRPPPPFLHHTTPSRNTRVGFKRTKLPSKLHVPREPGFPSNVLV